jgi:subtilase family serine protease
MSRLSRTTCAAIGVAAVVTAAAAGTASAATSGKHPLPGSVPSWAVAGNRVASSPSGTAVTFRVYLSYRGGDAAAAYARSVSTPGSADYKHFLTPAQFRDRFAPAQADVKAVSSWLRGEGFSLGAVPTNRKYVEATGTLAQASTAFGTSFAQYRTEGRTVRANTSPLQVPSSLTAVEGVVGLDESQTLAHEDTVTPGPALFRNAQPMSAYWGEKTVQNTPTPDGTALPAAPSAFAPVGYAGAQLQGLYGMTGAIGSGNDGRGVTVGIIDAYASATILQDANEYSARHGLPSLNGHFSQVVAPGTYNRPPSPAQDPQGWAGEETLDVEAVHTMAPGADIVYIGAPNNYRDMDAIMNKVVDNHLADIVSNSYGYAGEALPTGTIKPQLDTQVQAAAEGITLFFSSGDNADETNGVAGASPSPDWPASSPWVTAVGGTSAGVSQDNSRVFELGWETTKRTLDKATTSWNAPTWLYGSGGGTSRLFAQPSYQAGIVPGSISQSHGGSPMRAVPDVAALGDPSTGMLVGETQTFPDGSQQYSEYRIGGTSLASPLYAGMFALAEQKAGHAFGLANPVLYGAGRGNSIDITKNDIAAYPGDVRSDYVNGVDGADGYVYSARTFDSDDALTIHVRPGYDDVTGVGVPNGQAWLDAVASS